MSAENKRKPLILLKTKILQVPALLDLAAFREQRNSTGITVLPQKSRTPRTGKSPSFGLFRKI